MRTVTWLRVVALATILLASTGGFTTAKAKTGSFTITYTGVPGTTKKVRVTAKDEDGRTYDDSTTVGAQSETQLRNSIIADLRSEGWVVQENGTNGIIVKGKLKNPPTDSTVVKVKEVDIGTSSAQITVNTDGTCTQAEALPGDKKFHFIVMGPNTGGSSPGTLVCNVGNHAPVNVPLSPNSTPTQVSNALFNALQSAGIVVTHAGIDDIGLDMTTNTAWYSPSGPLHVELELRTAEAGPHIQVALPPANEKSTSLPGISPLGLVAVCLLLASSAAFLLWRRRTAYR